MSARTLLTLSASVLLGAAIAAPNAALAQFGPPPGPPPTLAGPPPGPVAGGPPPGLAGGLPPGGSPAGPVAGVPPRGGAGAGAPPRDLAGGRHLDGPPGPHGFDRGGSGGLRGVEARAAAYGVRHTAIVTAATATAMAMPVASRYWPYAAAAAYAYGRSYASSDDGCYYVSTYRRYSTRRVLVCHGN